MDAEIQQSATTTEGSEEQILGLSPKAAEKVKEIQAAETIDASYGLRLRVVGGGCSGFAYDLYFDQVTEADRTLESHGVKLVVDQMSLQYLAGTVVDYVEGLQGAGFKFMNPNVKSTCGCGSSFQV
jgi:iron-sulfur cluster assembly accessory protein